jgi:hypothetical protein
MKASARRFDGGRQRCVDCGHPRKEHAEATGCSVPKCACDGYTQVVSPKETQVAPVSPE